MMRLRLRIERNALPPTQALWPVKDAKCTIAQLLDLINQVFPLEAENWGLEDYAVSVGGFECLHYYEVGSVCKDDDEVLVKALQYVDVRSRTLSGRAQIAQDGRHLVDGVPFGKPALRTPVRPKIRIPPRKKRKLNLQQDGKESHVGEEDVSVMLMENEEESSDEDEDFEGSDRSDSSSSSSSQGKSSEDSDSSGDSESSDSDADDSSDSSSEDEESWDGLPSSEPPTPSRNSEKPRVTNGISKNQQPPAEKSTKAKRKQPSDASEEGHAEHHDDSERRKQITDHVPSQATEPDRSSKFPTTNGLPFEGKIETKRRNARRRDTKKLKHLVNVGTLPKDATLETLHQWENTKQGLNAGQVAESGKIARTVDQDSHFEQQRARLLADIASGGIDVTPEQQKKRKELRSSITSRSADDHDEPPSEEDNHRLPPTPLYPALTELRAPEDSTTDEAANKPLQPLTPRSRLDLAGSNRLVFGSLGVRVPKTQEEKDELQKKLADRPKKNLQPVGQTDSSHVNGVAVADTGMLIQTANEEEYDGEWRSKINLTAVECSDQGVTLSTPPFPFHQRWDSQYRKKKAKKRVDSTYMQNGMGKKRKRSKYIETYDKYNVNGNGDALDYDDIPGSEEDWEEGALLDGEDEDEEADDVDDSDGWPALPENIDELPILQEKEVCHGDFITYTELACDESTKWQPKMVARTAQILDIPADEATPHYCIQLSRRDMKPKVFDEEGNRVYSKFEMPDDQEEDDDRGERYISWDDMGIVRLVDRPEPLGSIDES